MLTCWAFTCLAEDISALFVRFGYLHPQVHSNLYLFCHSAPVFRSTQAVMYHSSSALEHQFPRCSSIYLCFPVHIGQSWSKCVYGVLLARWKSIFMKKTCFVPTDDSFAISQILYGPFSNPTILFCRKSLSRFHIFRSNVIGRWVEYPNP